MTQDNIISTIGQQVRIYCDRCNHGLTGNPSTDDYCKAVVEMMIRHRNNSSYLAAHRAGTTVYFPKWLITAQRSEEAKQ